MRRHAQVGGLMSARAWSWRRTKRASLCSQRSQFGVCQLSRGHRRSHSTYIAGDRYAGDGREMWFSWLDDEHPLDYTRRNGKALH